MIELVKFLLAIYTTMPPVVLLGGVVLNFKLDFFENCDLWWNSGGILSGMCHGQSETKMEPIASEESVLFLIA